MNTRTRAYVVPSLALASMLTTGVCAATHYVDDDADPGGDGSSWPTAFRDLQAALAVAQAGDEVWVAQGTYLPSDRGDRTASFILVDGSALIGGFAGLGAVDPDERDVAIYATILSGDLFGNDGPGFANNDDNSLHVVQTGKVGPATQLCGVTITAGNANGSGFDNVGGGVLNLGGSPTLEHCRIEGNMATSAGGGMISVFGGNATLSDCMVLGNLADGATVAIGGGVVDAAGASSTYVRCSFHENSAVGFGGGYGIQEAAATFSDCRFESNTATAGGGLISDTASIEVDRCVFLSNLATSFAGGGMAIIAGPSAKVSNTLFVDNEARDGGAVATNGGSPAFLQCTMTGNRAAQNGLGGAYFDAGNASSVIRSSVIWDNSPNEVVQELGSVMTIQYSDVRGGWAGAGNIDVDPLFVDPKSDWRLAAGSPAIDAGDADALPVESVVDLNGNPRFDDDPCTADSGAGGSERFPVDMGAYEFIPPCPVDLDCNGVTDVADLLRVLSAFGTCGWCLEDIDGSGDVDMADVLAILDGWGGCG